MQAVICKFAASWAGRGVYSDAVMAELAHYAACDKFPCIVPRLELIEDKGGDLTFTWEQWKEIHRKGFDMSVVDKEENEEEIEAEQEVEAQAAEEPEEFAEEMEVEDSLAGVGLGMDINPWGI